MGRLGPGKLFWADEGRLTGRGGRQQRRARVLNHKSGETRPVAAWQAVWSATARPGSMCVRTCECACVWVCVRTHARTHAHRHMCGAPIPEGEALRLAALAGADLLWAVEHHLGLLAQRLAHSLDDAFGVGRGRGRDVSARMHARLGERLGANVHVHVCVVYVCVRVRVWGRAREHVKERVSLCEHECVNLAYIAVP
jgi:hypothetical protein